MGVLLPLHNIRLTWASSTLVYNKISTVLVILSSRTFLSQLANGHGKHVSHMPKKDCFFLVIYDLWNVENTVLQINWSPKGLRDRVIPKQFTMSYSFKLQHFPPGNGVIILKSWNENTSVIKHRCNLVHAGAYETVDDKHVLQTVVVVTFYQENVIDSSIRAPDQAVPLTTFSLSLVPRRRVGVLVHVSVAITGARSFYKNVSISFRQVYWSKLVVQYGSGHCGIASLPQSYQLVGTWKPCVRLYALQGAVVLVLVLTHGSWFQSVISKTCLENAALNLVSSQKRFSCLDNHCF